MKASGYKVRLKITVNGAVIHAKYTPVMKTSAYYAPNEREMSDLRAYAGAIMYKGAESRALSASRNFVARFDGKLYIVGPLACRRNKIISLANPILRLC